MQSIDHADLGTPAIQSDKKLTLEIDGAPVTVPEGTSIMRAAASAGRKVIQRTEISHLARDTREGEG